MKTAVYITRNKIWAEENAYDWDGKSLDEVLGKVKKDLKTDGFRIVLGNDVSFVTAVKAGDVFLNRENVLKLVKSWMPFEIDDSCFDWKKIILAHDEVWVQVVALEKELMMSLTSAVKKHGIKIELITSIGVLLGKTTMGREAPVVIKWVGRENLWVLAIDGLTDLVVSDMSSDELMSYAKRKWNLAVNPEEITIKENDFNLKRNVFAEKTKGDDGAILNLPILRDIYGGIKPEERMFKGDFMEEISQSEKNKNKSWVLPLIIFVTIMAGAVVMYITNSWKVILPNMTSVPVEVTPTPSPTEVITPEPTKVDLGKYKVQVLNGSGVVGEAGKIKKALLTIGFVTVDTGNSVATSEGTIKSKSGIPQEVIEELSESMRDYKMGSPSSLPEDNKYGVVVVIGKTKEL